MKRRYIALIIVVAVSNLVLVGIQMVRSMPSSCFEIESKRATLDDQRKFLKKHEDELLADVKKINPDITGVQFNWNTVDEGKIENGLPQGGSTVVEITGRFNNIKESKVILQFAVDKKSAMANLKGMAVPDGFLVKKGEWWMDYVKSQ